MNFPQPSSPGNPPIQIRDCVEELLKFILESSLNETLDFGLTLSKNYCFTLLKHDLSNDVDDDPNSYTSDTFEGVPPYPLYKHLATALYQAMISKPFMKTSTNMMPVREENSMLQKEDEWNQLVVDMGTELVNLLKTADFELHVQEPFFSQLKDELKTVEGRCATGNYKRIGLGALILFNKILVLEVQAIREYASFSEMLEAEGLAKVLPGVKTIEEGVRIYRKFYSEDKEKCNGVLAICVGKPAGQPYTALTKILSELNYEGIQRLLGLVHTVGTVSDTLSPPKSALLSSFLLPFKQNHLD